MNIQTTKITKKIIKKFLYVIQKNPISIFRFELEIAKRSKLPFTDIKGLTKHINLFSPFTHEINPANDYYGHASTLKKFLNLPQKYQFKFVIEHGVYLADQVCDIDTDTPFSTILTCNTFRTPLLKKYKANVYPIGPYLYYAQNLLSTEEISKEKKRLGKNLLVFPAHSIPGINAQFDIAKFCVEIKKISKKFDSVRICLYWQDVLHGYGDQYLKQGFECVTAGHVLDPNFLPRLKSIIESSTATLSNDIGAYSGYSVILKKPHTIIDLPLKFKGKKKEIGYIDDLHEDKLFQKLLNAFSVPLGNITSKQTELVNYAWGVKEIKTKEQLKKIIERTEAIYQSERFKFL